MHLGFLLVLVFLCSFPPFGFCDFTSVLSSLLTLSPSMHNGHDINFGLLRVSGVTCDKRSISRNERKGVEDAGDPAGMYGLQSVTLRKKKGGRVGGIRD